MKRRQCAGLALLMCIVCLFAGSFAQELASMMLVGVHAETDAARVQLGIRLLDSEGCAFPAKADEVTVYANDQSVRLPVQPVQSQGHLIVVDTSRYYYGRDYVTDQNIRDLIAAYLARVPSGQPVRFILAQETDSFVTDRFSVTEAARFASTLTLGRYSSSCINAAVGQAFDMAIRPEDGMPPFNSIFIIADPDQESNAYDGHGLDKAVAACEYSGAHPPVLLAVPYRESFLKNAGSSKREALQQSFEAYRTFCRTVGGTYAEIPQASSSIDTAALERVLDSWMDAALYLTVDCSPLAGSISGSGLQQVPLQVLYDDGRMQTKLTVSASVNTDLLQRSAPAPTATVKPDLFSRTIRIGSYSVLWWIPAFGFVMLVISLAGAYILAERTNGSAAYKPPVPPGVTEESGKAHVVANDPFERKNNNEDTWADPEFAKAVTFTIVSGEKTVERDVLLSRVRPYWIGRKSHDLASENADLQLEDAPGTVSRRHVELQVLDNDIYLYDTSRNGSTRVNRKKAPRLEQHKPLRLKSGDRIAFPGYTITITWDEDEPDARIGMPHATKDPVEE